MNARTQMRLVSGGAILLALLMCATVGEGVILYRTGDPAANTTEPGGPLAGSGWQYEGNFGAFLGTAIAPHYFITAKHLGKVADKFIYHGTNYTIVRGFADSQSDLQIFEVTEALPKYASLYQRSDEMGQHLVVIGRGTQRGSAKVVSGQVRGWEYGPSDSVWRWGENKVASVHENHLCVRFGGGRFVEEAHLSAGDSGGAVFLNDGGIWKLAGINSDVDHFASGPEGGRSYSAAMFDERGSYQVDGTLISGDEPLPSAFYAARISSRIRWIRSVIGKVQPSAKK